MNEFFIENTSKTSIQFYSNATHRYASLQLSGLHVVLEVVVWQDNLLAWLEGRQALVRTAGTAERIAQRALACEHGETQQTQIRQRQKGRIPSIIQSHSSFDSVHTLPHDESRPGRSSISGVRRTFFASSCCSSSARPHTQFLQAGM